MPEQERMTIEDRYNYLRAQRRRYQGADRQDKSRLLDEIEAVTGLHRKSLIRLLRQEPWRMGDVRRLMAAIAEEPPSTLLPKEAALTR